MLKLLPLLLCLLGPSWIFAQAQDFFREDNSVIAPHHVELSLGVSNFLGDLGGKDGTGTNDFRDLEFTEFNFSTMVGYRYSFLKNLYGRVNFVYGRVSGNDNLTQEPFRRNRNLHFRSDIFEVNVMPEFWLRIGGKKGHQYNLERVGKQSGPWKIRASYITFFAGIGYFHFNPKAEVQGSWVNLQPLRTEGQGLPGGPEEYKKWGWNIPVGMSYMVKMSKKWGFGIELNYRFTFTDYIDDVSGVYYNAADIALYNNDSGQGELSAYLSDPSLGIENGGLSDAVTAPGQQRGDATDNDGYLFASFKIDYWFDETKGSKLKWKRKKFVKRKRK
jgi:hypothetical protein